MAKKKNKLVSGYYDANTSTRVTDANIEEDNNGWRIVKNNQNTIAPAPSVNNNRNNSFVSSLMNIQNDVFSKVMTFQNQQPSILEEDNSLDTFTDTGKKYGDYFYFDYENKKDNKIYKKGNNYYLFDDKTNSYVDVNQATNRFTDKKLEKEELEKAKQLGYKEQERRTSKEYDKANSVFKKLQKQYKLSDKELQNFIDNGDLSQKHVSLVTNSMRNTTREAVKYRNDIKEGKIKQYDDTVLSINDRLDLDTANLTNKKYNEYEEDLLRQQEAKDNQKDRINYGYDGTLSGTLKALNSTKNKVNDKIDKEVIYPIKHAKENYELGKKNNQLALEYYKKMEGKKNNAEELAQEMDKYQYFNKDLINNPGWAGTAIQNANTQVESLKKQGIGATVLGTIGSVIGTVINPGTGTVAGLKAGSSIGYTLGSTPYTYKLEAGNQYKTLLDMGVPDKIAKKHSKRVGAINAAIESGENIVDLFTFNSGSGTKAITKQTVSDLVDEYGEKQVNSWLSKKIGDKAANMMVTSAKSYLQNIASESVEEMTQEASSIVGERLAAKESNVDRNVSLKDDLSRVLEAGSSAAISTAFTAPISSVSGSIATNTMNNIQSKIENKVVKSNVINNEIMKEINKSNSNISNEDALNIQRQVYQELDNNGIEIVNAQQNNKNEKYSNVNPPMVIKYQETDNQKINTFRQSAVKEGMLNSKKTTDAMNVIEKIIQDKDYNVKFDRTITNLEGKSVDGKISINKNGEVEIALNPNSDRAVEFLLTHEVTHAIETKELRGIILDYAKKNPEFKSALKDLQKTYGTTNVNDEVVADISGQILGNQEFINSLSMQNTEQSRSFISKIYHSIQRLLNKLTAKGRYRNFVHDLETKWRYAYRSATNETSKENLSNDSKYVQKLLKDGTKYIETENGLFVDQDGKSLSQRQIFKSIVGKQIIFNDGIVATIKEWLPNNKNMYNELFKRYPKYQGVNNIKEVNNNINENSLELLENSDNISPNEPDYMGRHKANKIKNFDTRKVSLYDGKNAYDLTFSIAKMNDETYVAYAKKELVKNDRLLNKIKKEAPTSKSRGVLPSVNNIPKSNKNVKSDISTKYSMQSKENNTQELDNSSFSLKEKQLEIIKKNNPVEDDYHTWIRNIDDIKTLSETLEDSDWEGYDEFNPDLTRQDILEAIDNGEIMVYSSYPIEQGTFISPSKMEAESYSANGKVYSKKVSINDVAWIDPTQGQYAKVENEKYSQKSSAWQEHLEKNYKATGTRTYFDEMTNKTKKAIAPIMRNVDISENNNNVVNNDKINLDDYDSKTERVIKSAERNVIVRSYKQLDSFIDEALDTQSNKALHFGRINETITQRIKRKLENLPRVKAPYLTKEKYDLVMNQSEIRHLIEDKTKMTRDDVHKYVKVLPDIVSKFDSASYSMENDSEGIRFKKKLPDGNYISFVLVSNKQGTLKAKSIHLDKVDYEAKKRSISPTNDVLKTPNRTSETDGAFASLDNNTTTNSQKKQIAPVSQYNMQQNEKNIPIAKEYQKNTIDEKKSNKDEYIRIANTINESIKGNTIVGSEVKERSWIETPLESDVVKDKVLIEDLDPDKINYTVKSNKKTLKKANKKIDLMGYEESVKYIKSKLNDDNISLTDIVMGERIIQEAIKKGDKQLASDLITDIAILGTELGQKVQALSIIQRLTPEGQLKMFQKIVKRAKIRGEKSFQDVEITPEMVELILNAYDKNGNFNQDDLNNRVEQFKQEIADQLKTSTEEKIDAWRYLSMLGNPKTHIRNIVSNVAMKGTVAYKNALARTLETVLPIKNRTKTWKKTSEEVKQYAKQTAIEMKDTITGNNKFSEKGSIESKKRIFKNKFLESLSNFNSDMLELEDWFFSKSAFINSFQEYLTANGIMTKEDINNNSEIIEKGKNYAVEQAEIATFRQYSKLASEINRIERNNKVAKYPIKAMVPFKKTPINVAKTGVKYSPLGLIKNISYDVVQLKKGNIEASQFIDNLSQGVTGTSLMLIGYGLSKAGILLGSGDDDKEGKYDSLLGKTGYSIKIGNKYYSLSWLSPVAMPLFVGSNFHEQLEEKKGWDMNVVSDTLAKTLDPLSEMSFVSSLNDALSSYGSGTDKIFSMGESVAQSYVGQFFPTLFSQFSNTFDDTKRSTKASSNSSYKFGEQTLRSIMYKIPGLHNKLEPSVDVWGNELKQSDNVLTRAFESFIAPYSKRKDITSKLDKEIKRVYKEVGNDDVIPGVPRTDITYKKEKYRMSANEYTNYKKEYGESANTMLKMLINRDDYKDSADTRKTRMIKKVYDYSKEIAKTEFLEKRRIKFDEDDFKTSTMDYEDIVDYILRNTRYMDGE